MYKQNNAIVKLMHVHEGITPEAHRSRSRKLSKPHFFCRTAKGISNEDFWKEIYDYIDSHYDLGAVKKIYVNFDEGN